MQAPRHSGSRVTRLAAAESSSLNTPPPRPEPKERRGGGVLEVLGDLIAGQARERETVSERGRPSRSTGLEKSGFWIAHHPNLIFLNLENTEENL